LLEKIIPFFLFWQRQKPRKAQAEELTEKNLQEILLTYEIRVLKRARTVSFQNSLSLLLVLGR
jgi:hypothetical protein